MISVLPLAALACWQVSRGPASSKGSAPSQLEADAVSSRIGADFVAASESSLGRRTTDAEQHPTPVSLRDMALSRLHAEATRQFVRAPGFGVGRIGQLNQIGQLGQISQIGGLGRIGVVQQQMPTLPKLIVRDWSIPTWSPGDLAEAEETKIEGETDLNIIHKQSLTDFATNRSPAQASAGPSPNDPRKAKIWEVKSIDLVGLLMHEEPVVYVSDKLEMTKLKQVPTRSLDFFESAGLEKLQKGEDLFARSQKETIRLLGAVRAQKQCLSCHDVAEGRLLGAFSYTLRVAQYQYR
jgi:hypothetical protein